MTAAAARRRGPALPLAAVGLPLLAGLAGLALLPWGEASVGGVLATLQGGEATPAEVILAQVRLPRAVAAILAGAGLGLSGALFQAVTRNPLASPGILGVNAGAHLALVLALVTGFAPAAALGLPIAFAGGLAGAALTYLVAGGRAAAPLNLALAGLAVTLALGALGGTLSLLFENQVAGLFVWGAGSPRQADWAKPLLALVVLPPLLLLALLGARGLNLLALDEEAAEGRGLAVGRLRLAAAGLATLAAALAVTLAGPIAFVGLVVPNLLRFAGVVRHAALLPLSALGGALLLLAADLAGQQIGLRAGGLPAGLMVALIGAPLLIFLILRVSRQARAEEGSPQLTALVQFAPALRRFLLLLLLLPLAVAATVPIGLQEAELAGLFAWLGGEPLGELAPLVKQRLARTLVALLAGAFLGCCGQLLQGVIRNPLAGPELIGVTQGAALAALIVVLLLPGTTGIALQAAAFAGGLAALGTILLLSLGAATPTRLALLGIAVAGLAAALSSYLVLEARLQVSQALIWLAGSTYAKDWTDLQLLLPWLALLPLAIAFAPALGLLALGDERASSLGLAVSPTRALLLLLAVALAAAAVSVVGAVGFIGLVAPHIARLLVGARERLAVAAAAVVGGMLLLLADLCGRTVLAPVELPSGLVAALLGAPYFLFLLLRSGRAARA